MRWKLISGIQWHRAYAGFAVWLVLFSCPSSKPRVVRLSLPSNATPADLPCPANSPSRIVITKPNEPGVPLLVSGTVFESDRRTRIAEALIYVYHTDARGLYAPPGSSINPRLFGCMKTDAQGGYEFRTIEPGHYPGGGVPMHIHVKIWAPGFREYTGELRFAGDPALTPDDVAANAKSGNFSDIRPLERGSGALLCRRDFVLQR
jgi:protocatechuate 3,4-dioxygenase beta subunit